MEINFMCCVSDSSHFFKVLPRDQKPLVILILLLRILDLLVRDPISSTCILESRIEPESLIQTVSNVLTTCSFLFAERQNHHLYMWLVTVTN